MREPFDVRHAVGRVSLSCFFTDGTTFKVPSHCIEVSASFVSLNLAAKSCKFRAHPIANCIL